MHGNGSKRYDISMLRDFLDHLLCELRLAQAELSSGNGAAAELSELVDVYRRKYNVPGMLEVCVVTNDVSSAAELQAAETVLHTIFADLRRVETSRLDELQGVFDEALRCCSQDRRPTRTFSAAELVAESEAEG
jgi:hypothetical protein